MHNYLKTGSTKDSGKNYWLNHDAAWINYTDSIQYNLTHGYNSTINPPSGSPNWNSIWSSRTNKTFMQDPNFTGCWECNQLDQTAYQAPLFDYSRCDKITAFAWDMYNFGNYYQKPLHNIKEIFEWCTPSQIAESNWNAMTFQVTNASQRHTFDVPNGTYWQNPQAIYNDTETNTSYFKTWCDTKIEFNTTWMQTTPTWKYDLNACINWMPYNSYRYAYGVNSTKSTTDSTLPTF